MGELSGQSYPLGFEPKSPGEPVGNWTIRVAGGPAFAMNAALSCRIAAHEATADSARAAALTRLAEAIEAVMDDG